MANKPRFGVQPRILIMFLCLSVLPMIVGIWFMLNHSETAFIENKGQQMSELAEVASMQLRHHLRDTAVQIDTLSFNPAVTRAVEAANLELGGNSDAIVKNAQEIEKTWSKLPAQDERVKKITGNELAVFLKKCIFTNKAFKEIAVLSRDGVLVAATNPTDHYLYSEPGWRNKVATNYLDHGAYVSDIKYNAIFKSFSFELAIPMFNADRELIGIIKAILKIEHIAEFLRTFNFGRTGQVMLTGTDGTIIASRDLDLTQQVTYDNFQKIQSMLGKIQKPYLELSDSGKEAQIIGLPKTQLKEEFPEANWYLFTVQNSSEALKPVAGMKETAITFMIILLIAVAVVAFWFSRELTKPVLEMDMHLEKI